MTSFVFSISQKQQDGKGPSRRGMGVFSTLSAINGLKCGEVIHRIANESRFAHELERIGGTRSIYHTYP